jgi:hypothetical protein
LVKKKESWFYINCLFSFFFPSGLPIATCVELLQNKTPQEIKICFCEEVIFFSFQSSVSNFLLGLGTINRSNKAILMTVLFLLHNVSLENCLAGPKMFSFKKAFRFFRRKFCFSRICIHSQLS